MATLTGVFAIFADKRLRHLCATALVFAVSAALSGQDTPGDKKGSEAAYAEFNKRVKDYLKVHNDAAKTVPKMKTTSSPADIRNHELEVAQKIRQARAGAKQGDIFTPEVTEEFRRLIAQALEANKKDRVKKSLERAEPVKVPLKINGEYPSSAPLQSTPPTLLIHLVQLPKELEYRISGNDLVLRDIEANMIVDFILKAIP